MFLLIKPISNENLNLWEHLQYLGSGDYGPLPLAPLEGGPWPWMA